MGIIKAIKNFRWGYLLTSILLCLAGVLVIAFQSETLKAVSYIIAGATFIVGIIQIIKLLAERKRGFGFAISIIFTVLTLVCGLVAFIIPDKVMELYPMFIGLLIVIDGAFKLQTVINAKRYKLKMWWFLLIFSCLTILGGFLTVRLRVGEVGYSGFSFILGFALIFSGFENFLSLFYLGKIVKMAKLEVDSYATDVTDSSVIADSYIETDSRRIKPEIIDTKTELIEKTGEPKKKDAPTVVVEMVDVPKTTVDKE